MSLFIEIASFIFCASALGTPYTGPYGVNAIPYSDHRFLMLIPLYETDVNPKLAEQQNPGW
jgi:hypothetical protein